LLSFREISVGTVSSGRLLRKITLDLLGILQYFFNTLKIHSERILPLREQDLARPVKLRFAHPKGFNGAAGIFKWKAN